MFIDLREREEEGGREGQTDRHRERDKEKEREKHPLVASHTCTD